MTTLSIQSDISLTQANHLIAQGIQIATQQGLNLSIAVVDRSGHLLAFARMDNASLVTIDVAIGKARTAAYLKAPSKLFEDFVNNGAPAMLATPNILPLQGGIPLLIENKVIGAVGVSGASSDVDNHTAETLANLFQTEQ
ncbi:GlcG/HbpS family heme-binding protein [Lonepinella koalarum]|uniref:GlcG/HbpS family heme-binding protein n=1 Tax=Lonepinella koalarum TaxID=53417 RepID=UPI003F6DF602